MDQAPHPDVPQTAGKVVDFDEAMLDACPSDVRADLLTEAAMLAQAFAPQGRADELKALADSLSRGGRDAEIGRAHARQLAAALRHLARGFD
jgi:hypothetical protein